MTILRSRPAVTVPFASQYIDGMPSSELSAMPADTVLRFDSPTEALQEYLLPFAKRYIWWKTPEEAVELPYRVIAQVMDIGFFDDVMTMRREIDAEFFKETLRRAEIGQFRPRSWSYWHYTLGLASVETGPPPMPTRRFM